MDRRTAEKTADVLGVIVTEFRNFIFPGLLGFASSLLLTLKWCQFLLYIKYPAVMQNFMYSSSDLYSFITGMVGFIAIYVIFRNISTWFNNKYATILLLLSELSLAAMTFTLCFSGFTLTTILIAAAYCIMFSVCCTYLVITDYNFIDGGHKNWFIIYSE